MMISDKQLRHDMDIVRHGGRDGVVLFIEMGQISPPIGINLFVIQSIWDGKLSEIVWGTIPFHLLMFVLLVMLVIWPEIALWLPHHMSPSR